MIDAQLDAGFDSASGFRQALCTPVRACAAPDAGAADLRADWIDTPLGGMIAIADDGALHLLEFTDRKGAAQGLRRLSVMAGADRAGPHRGDRPGRGRPGPVLRGQRRAAGPAGAPARHAVPDPRLAGTAGDSAGRTRSYAQLAAAIGHPTAVRAVAAANGANRLALVVPCHRVIGTDGTMTGYAGGLWRKERLIALERGYGIT